MTTYRACYYKDTVLTGPEHAHLTDDELRAEAIAEAHRADLIGAEYPAVTEDELRTGLNIGDWSA